MLKISDRPGIGNRWFWAGFVSAPCVVVSVRLVAVSGAANTSRVVATGRGFWSNACECFIESSFNASLKVMFLQDRRTPVT